ncbi:MAG: hypothetical protein EP330_15215 [Deltaproteobacteria bacterium]|nr:MAG: hypothetical protein EP330_15215 [Deltaproteobacteria bacterium]
MSDLHSVAPRAAGGAWVTSTGIDAVLGVDEHGAVVERWDLGTRRVDGDVRGRAYRDLKPHEVHPNLAAEWGDTLWVTCFEEQRARSRDGREIAFPEGPPHDGHVREGLVWFTTVTGHVIAVDPADGRRVEHYDLNEMAGVANPLGWCRGVEVLGDLVYVGMTQLRASAHREVARRLLRGAEGVPLPSRIVVFSRANREIVREIAYGNRAGGTIHAILAIRDE